MWFESMHQEWRDALADWKPWLDQKELSIASVSDLVPPAALVLAAFQLPPSRIRVILLGQDPYPTAGVAIGRAFAVSRESDTPASLRNLFRELTDDIGCNTPPSRTLNSWEEQGVWLLNRHLTASAGEAGAHLNAGWQEFTDAAIKVVITLGTPVVLLLLGNQAQTITKSLASELAEGAHRIGVVSAPHPSPLSAHRGFFGSKIYSRVNAELSRLGSPAIEWCADNHAT